MNQLSIDIETVKDERAEEYFKQKKYKPNSKLSTLDNPPAELNKIKSEVLKQEKLNAWREKQTAKINNSIEEQRSEAFKKAGLCWWTGKIICISSTDVQTDETVSFWGDDEKKLLNEFMAYVTEKKPRYSLTGKQTKDFDIPFIIGRCLRWSTGLIEALRPVEYPNDVNLIFGYSASSGQRGQLSDYAWGIEVSGKTHHGFQVQEMYDVAMLTNPSMWNEIVKYCEQDTKIPTEMLKRYYKPFELTVTPKEDKGDNIPH